MEIASKIDHTNLNPLATSADIKKLCDEARSFHFASVCVNPSFVSFAAQNLKDSDVKVCTVIGFPLGADTIDNKAASAAVAVDEGASEIDFVQNLAFVKEKKWDDLEDEIRAVVDSSNSVYTQDERKIVVKVILETCFLSDDEIVKCCQIAKKAGADFVKTSTGFASAANSGATEHAVSLMRKTVGDDFGVKASGGIRTKSDVLKMLAAGANRIGTSSGIKIISEK